jgi:hypothetical protein
VGYNIRIEVRCRVIIGRKRKLSELQARVTRERIAKGESARSIPRIGGGSHHRSTGVAQEGAWLDHSGLSCLSTLAMPERSTLRYQTWDIYVRQHSR